MHLKKEIKSEKYFNILRVIINVQNSNFNTSLWA